jgi:Uma2 family endonuclease
MEPRSQSAISDRGLVKAIPNLTTMTVTVAKWTVDEYHRIIAAGILDDRRVELLKGEIIEMSPEGQPHAYFSSEAANYLVRLLGDRAMIRSAKPITLPNYSEPEPDIAVVQNLGREYLEHHPYPENIFWLIEYSESTLDKDLGIKSQVYAEVNISEYWVVNLQKRELIVFRNPQNREYTSRSTFTEQTIYPLAFPDLAISVDLIVTTM